MTTAERFVDERDLSVWERITGGLSILDRLVDGDARDALHGRVAALVGPVRAELGADADPGEDDRTRTLRGVLLQAAALLGDDVAAQERAADLLDQFLAHPPSVDPSLASPALVVCATFGDVALHERLVAAFHGAANPQDRQRLQLSLARFRSPEALQRTLDMTLSGDIRTPGRALPAGRDGHQPRQRRAGVELRGRRTGTTSSSGSRPTACPASWAASARSATATSPRRSRRSSTSTRSPRATSRCASTSSAWA